MPPNYLNKITIYGFKSIRALSELTLTPLNVLIGANGSGKSNFISVFKLLNEMIQSRLQAFVGKEGGADNLLYFGQKITDKIEIALYFSDGATYCCDLIPATGDNLIFDWEEITVSGPNPQGISLGEGHKETELNHSPYYNQYKTIAYLQEYLKRIKVYHFHDTSATAKVKFSGDIHDNHFFRPDAANLAAYLYLLKEKHEQNYQEIVRIVQLAAPFFDDFVLQPSAENPDKIRLEWREKDSDKYFNASTLSDGTLRFICLATLLLQPKLPAIILLDEPELGLHPFAIHLLVELFKSVCTSQSTQLIVSTQSVTLINQLQPEDILVVEREKGQSTFKRLNANDLSVWLEDYSLGDLWEKNFFGGRP